MILTLWREGGTRLSSSEKTKVVRGTGFEPARLSAVDPKSTASANFAIPALSYFHCILTLLFGFRFIQLVE
jgi:hypothetical protein